MKLVLLGLVTSILGFTAAADETPQIEDETIIAACLKQVAATFELPEGLGADIMRPSCECVAREATTAEMRSELLASTKAGTEAERAASTSEDGRQLLRKCFNVQDPA